MSAAPRPAASRGLAARCSALCGQQPRRRDHGRRALPEPSAPSSAAARRRPRRRRPSRASAAEHPPIRWRASRRRSPHGKQLFVQMNCAGCHGYDLRRLDGPEPDRQVLALRRLARRDLHAASRRPSAGHAGLGRAPCRRTRSGSSWPISSRSAAPRRRPTTSGGAAGRLRRQGRPAQGAGPARRAGPRARASARCAIDRPMTADAALRTCSLGGSGGATPLTSDLGLGHSARPVRGGDRLDRAVVCSSGAGASGGVARGAARRRPLDAPPCVAAARGLPGSTSASGSPTVVLVGLHGLDPVRAGRGHASGQQTAAHLAGDGAPVVVGSPLPRSGRRPRLHHRQRDPHPGRPAGARRTDHRRRHPLLLGPAAGRQDGRHSRPDQRHLAPGRPRRASIAASAPSTAALQHAHMALFVVRRHARPPSTPGATTSCALPPRRRPPTPRAGARAVRGALRALPHGARHRRRRHRRARPDAT